MCFLIPAVHLSSQCVGLLCATVTKLTRDLVGILKQGRPLVEPLHGSQEDGWPLCQHNSFLLLFSLFLVKYSSSGEWGGNNIDDFFNVI